MAKVVATIETPNNHQGMCLPERKNSLELLPAFLLESSPMTNETMMRAPMMVQSRLDRAEVANIKEGG
jgi:hypothetical protein